MLRIKRGGGDVRGEGQHRMGLESQAKKIFQRDSTVVNVDTSVRSLDITLPIFGDLQKQYQ